ncbi:MAG: porin family protein [Bacteroidia bacterium]
MNSRKIIYLSIIIFLNLNYYGLFAQKIHLGIKGDFSLCSQTGKLNVLEKQDFIVQPALGVYLQESLSKHWFLQQEIIYGSRGVKYSLETNSEVDTSDLKLVENGTRTSSYLDVPILLGYKAGKFSAFVGGQASFLLAAKLQRNFTFTYTHPNAGQEIIRSSDENDKKDNYTPFQYGIIGGIGFEVRPKFTLGARYYYGISPLYKGEVRVSQQAIMLGASFQIL